MLDNIISTIISALEASAVNINLLLAQNNINYTFTWKTLLITITAVFVVVILGIGILSHVQLKSTVFIALMLLLAILCVIFFTGVGTLVPT